MARAPRGNPLPSVPAHSAALRGTFMLRIVAATSCNEWRAHDPPTTSQRPPITDRLLEQLVRVRGMDPDYAMDWIESHYDLECGNGRWAR